MVSYQPPPWSERADGTLVDAKGKAVRVSGLGTALNATGIFPHADENRAFMLRAIASHVDLITAIESLLPLAEAWAAGKGQSHCDHETCRAARDLLDRVEG